MKAWDRFPEVCFPPVESSTATVRKYRWRCRLCEQSNAPDASVCEACGYSEEAKRRAAREGGKRAFGSGWLARLLGLIRR